jgi:hypothetical protein
MVWRTVAKGAENVWSLVREIWPVAPFRAARSEFSSVHTIRHFGSMPVSRPKERPPEFFHVSTTLIITTRVRLFFKITFFALTARVLALCKRQLVPEPAQRFTPSSATTAFPQHKSLVGLYTLRKSE